MNSKLLKFKQYEIEKAQLMHVQGQGGVQGCYECCLYFCIAYNCEGNADAGPSCDSDCAACCDVTDNCGFNLYN